MTREEAIAELKVQQVIGDYDNPMGDIEAAHVEADGVLRKLLIALGYEDVVAEYDKIDTWCA